MRSTQRGLRLTASARPSSRTGLILLGWMRCQIGAWVATRGCRNLPHPNPAGTLPSNHLPRNRILLNIQEILDNLPHRYPMLLVDRILEMDAGKRAKGL